MVVGDITNDGIYHKIKGQKNKQPQHKVQLFFAELLKLLSFSSD